MFGFGKKPAPLMPPPETLKQVEEIAKGGALAFIADTEKAATEQVAVDKPRQASQIARVRAVLRDVMTEETPFVLRDGVPQEHAGMAVLGCALVSAAAAMGDEFNVSKPDNNPAELMMTIQSFANVFLSRQGRA